MVDPTGERILAPLTLRQPCPQAHLLQQLRPTDFRSFGAFLTWRQDVSQLLTAVLGLAARETSRANSRLAASCRSQMVRAA